MHRLTRTVRFSLGEAPGSRGGGVNGFGGKPAGGMLTPYLELDVCCVGEPDTKSGYLINIKAIDDAVRTHAVPGFRRALAAGETAEPGLFLVRAADAIAGSLRVDVAGVRLRLTPHLSLETPGFSDTRAQHEMERGMTQSMNTGTVIVRQRFEFSASHRLHVGTLSDEENRELFGKCNNPAGHGHNYRVEPAVEVDADGPVPVGMIEAIVDERVLERFDHKHLNTQTEEFGEGGLNPSVENIARVCHGLLEGPIADAGGRLRAVTVWETDRTSSTYPA